MLFIPNGCPQTLYLWDHLFSSYSGAVGFVCPRPRRTCPHHETTSCISTALQTPLSSLLTCSQTKKNLLTSIIALKQNLEVGTHIIVSTPWCCSISGFSPVANFILLSSFIQQIFIEELLCACHTLLWCWGYSSECDHWCSCPHRSCILMEKPIKK